MQRALIVDCDPVALLRDAGGAGEPRLAAFALAAELAGADALRVSVHETLRPVRESDLYDLRRVVRRFEIQLAPTPSLLKLALEVRPDRVILASEPTASRRTGAPLETTALRGAVALAARALREAGIPAFARIAPDPEAVKLARAADVAGIELATAASFDGPEADRSLALDRCGDAARIAGKLRLPVAAGGNLEAERLRELLAVAPSIERVAVGRALASRALLVGLERAVRELRDELR